MRHRGLEHPARQRPPEQVHPRRALLLADRTRAAQRFGAYGVERRQLDVRRLLPDEHVRIAGCGTRPLARDVLHDRVADLRHERQRQRDARLLLGKADAVMDPVDFVEAQAANVAVAQSEAQGEQHHRPVAGRLLL